MNGKRSLVAGILKVRNVTPGLQLMGKSKFMIKLEVGHLAPRVIGALLTPHATYWCPTAEFTGPPCRQLVHGMAAQAQWQQAPIILRYSPIQMYDAAALRRHPSSPGSNGAVNYWFFGSNCDTPAAARSLGLHMWNAKKAAESIGADAGANPIFTGLAREVNGIIRYPLYYLSPPTLQTEEQHDEVTRRFEEDDHSGTLETTGFVAGGLSIWKRGAEAEGVPAYPVHSQYYFHVIGRSVTSLCMHPHPVPYMHLTAIPITKTPRVHLLATAIKDDIRIALKISGVHTRVASLMQDASYAACNAAAPRNVHAINSTSAENLLDW